VTVIAPVVGDMLALAPLTIILPASTQLSANIDIAAGTYTANCHNTTTLSIGADYIVA